MEQVRMVVPTIGTSMEMSNAAFCAVVLRAFMDMIDTGDKFDIMVTRNSPAEVVRLSKGSPTLIRNNPYASAPADGTWGPWPTVIPPAAFCGSVCSLRLQTYIMKVYPAEYARYVEADYNRRWHLFVEEVVGLRCFCYSPEDIEKYPQLAVHITSTELRCHLAEPRPASENVSSAWPYVAVPDIVQLCDQWVGSYLVHTYFNSDAMYVHCIRIWSAFIQEHHFDPQTHGCFFNVNEYIHCRRADFKMMVHIISQRVRTANNLVKHASHSKLLSFVKVGVRHMLVAMYRSEGSGTDFYSAAAGTTCYNQPPGTLHVGTSMHG